MKLRKRHILLLFVVLLFVCLLFFYFKMNKGTSFSSIKDYPEIKGSGVLHVVTEYSHSVFFRNEDTISGKQYEMVTALSEYLGIPVEFYLVTSLQESVEGLNDGKYDLIARQISVTSELREKIAFTDNIMLDKQILVQRNRSDTSSVYVRNQLDLPGKKIYVTTSSPYISRLKNLANEIGDTLDIIEMPNYECEHLLILVAKGDIDYTVCDYETANRMSKDYPILDIDTEISFSQMQAWGVRKDSPQLLDSINAWLKQWKQQSVRQKKKM